MVLAPFVIYRRINLWNFTVGWEKKFNERKIVGPGLQISRVLWLFSLFHA